MRSTRCHANILDLVLRGPQSIDDPGTTPSPSLGRRSKVLPLHFLNAAGVVLSTILFSSLFMMSHAPAFADDAKTNRVQIEYVPPTNPGHQKLYELLKERRVLEKLQEVFSPFRLPIALTLTATGCNGMSNAWYHRPSITLCYEYMDEIQRSMPKETTAAGIAPLDALVGQFFYVVAHEMGHAMFDYLDVPVFGRAEDAADTFSAYIMLHFGKEDARRLITGAAYSYKIYVEAPTVTVPLKAFSDVHGAPVQRFYNLLCLAYGADANLFADVATKYLPKERSNDCEHEYNEARFAFQKLIVPYLDEQLAKQVLDKAWLPNANAQSGRK